MRRNTLIGGLCLIMAVAFNSSCSDNRKMEVLLENIPEKTDFVLVGNLKTIIESAGGTTEDSKIKLPSYLTSSLPGKISDELDDANSFLSKAGIDVEACALMADFEKPQPVIVFSLTDNKKFVEAIEGEGFKEKSSEGDITFYRKTVYESSYGDYSSYGYMAVNGSCAYWIESVWEGSDFKPVPYLQKIIDKAKDSNFADTPYADYILSGNAGGLSVAFPKKLRDELKENGVPSDMASLYDGTFCMRGELAENQCTVNFKLFDRDGKEVSAEQFAKYYDTSATINEKALALLGKDEFVIGAVSLKNMNWDNFADMFAGAAHMSRSDRAGLNAVLGYLEKIDGTVAYGFGLTNGLESVASMSNGKDPLNQFSATLVVETKEGKAKQMVEDMKGFLEKAQFPFDETLSGLSVPLERTGVSGSIYIKQADNFIVLANHPIQESNDNALVKETNLADNLAAFCIGLDKDNKLMRDLDVDNNVRLIAYTKPNVMESSMVLEIDGNNDGGVIAKFAKIVIKIMDQSKDIERRFENAYTPEEDYGPADTVLTASDEYDTEYADTAAVYE